MLEGTWGSPLGRPGQPPALEPLSNQEWSLPLTILDLWLTDYSEKNAQVLQEIY